MSNPIKPATDLFSTEISPVIDEANEIIAELGLRPYRVFLVVERYEGPGRRQGPLQERGGIKAPFDVPTEILPRPEVVSASPRLVAMSQGALQAGDAMLQKISRVNYTFEYLRGKASTGGDLPKNEQFVIALVKTAGSSSGDLADLYNPTGEPELLPTGWWMPIRPLNRRVRLVISPDG